MRIDDDPPIDFEPLWDDAAGAVVPIMLVRGGDSFHVQDDDVTEFRKRVPTVRVELVDGAGHSVQSDRPVELARLIQDFVFPDTKG
jgi:pimeloyl-ACP methyl ester carboxylesterase